MASVRRPIAGGAGLTNLVISDSSAGRYLPMLLDVAGNEGARLERALGAAMASSLLARRYGAAEGAWRPSDLDGDLYQAADGGIAPLPYASSDLALTSLVAIVSPDEFRAADLRAYLGDVKDDPKSTRERRMYALAGSRRASGTPVLPELRRRRRTEGSRPRAADDRAGRRRHRRCRDRPHDRQLSCGRRHGEQLAAQARLRVGETVADSTDATARMAVLAAAIGDAHAPALWAYVEANPSTEVPVRAVCGRLRGAR